MSPMKNNTQVKMKNTEQMSRKKQASETQEFTPHVKREFTNWFDDGIVPLRADKSHFNNSKEEKRFKRMTARANRKTFVIYPEDKLKATWDLFITIVLLITCVNTPWNIAF